MHAGKIVALVIGILMVLVALGLLVPGSFILGIYGMQRDEDGFFETSSRVLSSDGRALVTPDVDLNLGGHWAPTGDWAAVRIKAASNADKPVFVGIGPSAEVSRYLLGVAHDEVTDFGWPMHSVEYRFLDGEAVPELPAAQDFWAESEEGTGTQVLEWDVAEGNWTVVVMNSDGSAPVSASVSLGARFDILLPIGIGMVVGGIIFLGGGILLIVVGSRRSPTPPPAQAQPVAAPYGPNTPSGPTSPGA